MEAKQNSTGVIWTAASAIGFGTMASLAILAKEGKTSVETMLFIRFTLAGILMFAWKFRQIASIDTRRKLTLFGMGGILYLVQSYCFFHGLLHAPPALVSILLFLYPVFVAIGSFVFFKERLSRVKVFALGLAVIGAALAIGPARGGDPLGIIYGISSAVAYSIYILVGSRVTKGIDGLAGTTLIFIGAATAYLIISLVQGFALPVNATGWLGCIGLGLISVVALGGFIVGIQLVGAVNASTISALEPITTALLGALIWGQHLTGVQWLGGAVILAAVVWLVRSR